MTIQKTPIGHFERGFTILYGAFMVQPGTHAGASNTSGGGGWTVSSVASGSYRLAFADKYKAIVPMSLAYQHQGSVASSMAKMQLYGLIAGTVDTTNSYMYIRTATSAGALAEFASANAVYICFTVAAKGTTA